jgi:1,4-alpha-glucan branching enzyme
MSPRPRSETGKAGAAARRRVSLVVPIGEADEVVVTGDFTGWSADGTRLKRRKDGAWTAALSLAPGEYQYRLVVDGAWGNNPAAERRVANAFGSENDILVVS